MLDLVRTPQRPDLAAYVAAGRALAQQTDCIKHGTKNAITCQECIADRHDAGPDGRIHWARTTAMSQCDERFPQRFRDAAPTDPRVSEWLDLFAADPTTAPWLLLFGTTGTGKTHQAYAAMRAAVLIHPETHWANSTFPDFAASLRPRSGIDSEAEMERYRDADLLLLDDVGTAKHSEWIEEITYRLFNGRYEAMRPTIVTTNLSLPELAKHLGDRVAGRLSETSMRVLLEGQDWRRRRAA